MVKFVALVNTVQLKNYLSPTYLFRSNMEKIWHRTIDCVPPDPPNTPLPIPLSHCIIRLPFYTIPMWSDGFHNYCTCIDCSAIITEPAQLCLLFTDTEWSVCVACIKPPRDVGLSCCQSILVVESLLKPIIDGACAIVDLTCDMCERWNCMDADCLEAARFINRSPLENRMELFYRNHVDIVSCLRFTVCHNFECDRVIDTSKRITTCGRCRRVCYCSKRCKKKCREHNCVPFEEVWRN